MGLFSSIGKIAGSIGSALSGGLKSVGKFVSPVISSLFGSGAPLSGLPGSILSGGVDMGFDWLKNEFMSKPNAEDAFKNNLNASAQAFDRSYDAYKNRYQDTMADMQKAGLNPILAAGSGGFNVSGQPTMAKAESPMATLPDTHSAQSYNQLAQAKTEEVTRKEKTQNIKKLEKETRLTLEKIKNERVRRGVIKEQERQLVAQIDEHYARIGKMFHEVLKIGAETELTETQKSKMLSEIKVIKEQFKMLKKQSDWYDGAYGQFLGWVKATLGALGLNVGVFAGLKK